MARDFALFYEEKHSAGEGREGEREEDRLNARRQPFHNVQHLLLPNAVS